MGRDRNSFRHSLSDGGSVPHYYITVNRPTVRTVFYEGSGEESYPGLKVQSDSKKDCAMDSLQNILTDALTTVGHFTNRNEPFSSHS
jgi:hypothetical protein